MRIGARLHLRQRLPVDHVGRFGRRRRVQADDVGRLQQLAQGSLASRPAAGRHPCRQRDRSRRPSCPGPEPSARRPGQSGPGRRCQTSCRPSAASARGSTCRRAPRGRAARAPALTPSSIATVCSATDSSSVPGVIVTAIPRSVAAGDVDRIVTHAHAGDGPQLRACQHVARSAARRWRASHRRPPAAAAGSPAASCRSLPADKRPRSRPAGAYRSRGRGCCARIVGVTRTRGIGCSVAVGGESAVVQTASHCRNAMDVCQSKST